VDALMNTLAEGVARLSPVARLRLLAFLHLTDRPDTIAVNFELAPTGEVRLVMSTKMNQSPASGGEESA
jgi:hypothetical protein